MKRSLVLSTLFVARLASATPPESDPKAVVEEKLLAPLKAKEGRQSRFSRAYLPPQERRLRLIDSKVVADARGAAFVTFAVDARHGYVDDEGGERSWRTDAIVGCVYPESRKVFVKRGEKYFGADLLLGKKTSAAGEHVCQGAAQVAAAR